MTYKSHFTNTPQSAPAPLRESEQVKNAAGGYVFKADDWTRLTRFLIIGSEGGSYYESERKLTLQNAEVVIRCAQVDFIRTVEEILRVSENALAPKLSPAILALALVVAKSSIEGRRYALEALPRICRTLAHLMEFVSYQNDFGTSNTQVKHAVAEWFNSKTADQISFQAVKYGTRFGWSMGDIVKYAHPNPVTEQHRWIYGWAIGVNKIDPRFTSEYIRTEHRWVAAEDSMESRVLGRYVPTEQRLPFMGDAALERIETFERMKSMLHEGDIVSSIRRFNMPREAVPNQWLNSVSVWEALLETMPTNALIRNLNKMTSIGMFGQPFSTSLSVALELLINENKVRKSRVHPLWVLHAAKQYGMGHGDRGSLMWTAHPRIKDALDVTFEYSFHNVEPVPLNIAVAVDCSGSMSSGQVSGIPGFTPLEAAAAAAMVYMRAQAQSYAFWFDSRLHDVNLSPKDSLNRILQVAGAFKGGSTNCGLVADEIARQRLPVDGIFMFTDGESWAGSRQTFQSIEAMRQAINRPTRWVTMQTTATEGQLRDPGDKLAMEVAGFSPDILTIANAFFGGMLG